LNNQGELSEEEANELVLEHRGWAISIARSVARAWNLDWEMDGLDGAAMEAIIFCSRRYTPSRGVPFKSYARKRIHEASSEAARKSKGWLKSSSSSSAQSKAREISFELVQMFPELRQGSLPAYEDSSGQDDGGRSSIRQLLVGASVIAARYSSESGQPDELMDYKRMVETIAKLESVHQHILWKMYWEGYSMRAIAEQWETDELNVIREHKVLLNFLHKSISTGRNLQPIRVRPGLKQIGLKVKREDPAGPFGKIVKKGQDHA